MQIIEIIGGNPVCIDPSITDGIYSNNTVGLNNDMYDKVNKYRENVNGK